MCREMYTMNFLYYETILEIIAKYGVLIREWGGFYYALFVYQQNSIVINCPCRWLDSRISDHC